MARRPHRAAPTGDHHDQFLPVVSDWSDPETLVEDVLAATGQHLAKYLIIWAHSPHREALMHELERVVAQDALVLPVWGSAGRDPREALTEQADSFAGHRVRHVILGYLSGVNGSRWLTHTEISTGVLNAMESTREIHVVGRLDPWDRHP
ncbi:hypothetical protein [Nesterenkonia muleiensis]|uniref:hypothetical protein n=1 Tax=Nesterenkonia muleiensis TaxID=2282648 RepID=UPI00138FE603|nr:hypothetical protein [Nesterenkonia muleiensis]